MIDLLSFEEAISYVKSLDVYGSVLGLSNMTALAGELSNPQDNLRFIHVTGTNGKGSVCAFLSAILTEAGYTVGSYNSPAVLSDIDQFSINTKTISEELYAKSVSIVKGVCERIVAAGGIQPTRFEVETMVAFKAFEIAECDIVVLETGLGGRDDATNIIKNTLVHVFTSISMDHSAVLGDTLSKIAENKSGIIKSSAPTVMYLRDTADMTDEEKSAVNDAADVISKRCSEYGSELHIVSDDLVSNIFIKKNSLYFDMPKLKLLKLKLSMKGAYQPANATVAVYAIKQLLDRGYVITRQDIEKGLKKAYIPFRFEKISFKVQKIVDDIHSVDITADDIAGMITKDNERSQKNMVDIILDGAHNPDGAKKLMKSLELVYPNREYIYVAGVFRDKDYEKIARITGEKAKKIFVIRNNDTERSLESEVLSNEFLKYNKNVVDIENVDDALERALKETAESGQVSDKGQHEAEEKQQASEKKRQVAEGCPVIVCFGSLSWLRYVKKYINCLLKGALKCL